MRTMELEKESRAARTGMVGAIVASVGASICCVGPVAAVMLGMTSLATLANVEFLRPVFTSITIALLGAAFFSAYRRRTNPACEPGSLCERQGPDRVRRANRIAVWTAAVVCLVVLTFPAWSTWLLG